VSAELSKQLNSLFSFAIDILLIQRSRCLSISIYKWQHQYFPSGMLEGLGC